MPPRQQEASAGVASLVASIRQHKKFRQLASYSVQCLSRAVSPPTVGWEQNLKEAYEAGAMEAVNEVLQRHKGDEMVLAAATQCFASMATKTQYATSMVESGVLEGMLSSVTSNPDAKEGVKETLQLLEAVSISSPEALLKHGGSSATVALLRASAAQPQISAACVRTLERVNKVAGAAPIMKSSGAVNALMEVAKIPITAEASTEMVETSMRVLERLCRFDDVAEYVRSDLDGMSVLCAALETNSTNDRVCKAGGRVLNKLAAGNVSGLVARMEASKSSSEREYLSGLLGNLALEEENADKIVKSGGVPALLKMFESNSVKAIEASARAITRIAAREENIDELIRHGGLSTMVKMMSAPTRDVTIFSAVTSTLSKVAQSVEHTAELNESGAVQAVVKELVSNPSAQQSVLDALTFIENMGTADFDMSTFVDLGALPAIVKAMQMHAAHVEVQLNATRCLIYMSYCEENIDVMIKEGVLPLCIKNLTADAKPLVLATVYLVTSIALVPVHKQALVDLGGVDKLLMAVATTVNEEGVKESADDLLSAVVGEAEVTATVTSFARALKEAEAPKATLVRVRDIASRLTALASSTDFADVIVRSGSVSDLVRALELVAARGPGADSESTLNACTSALQAVTVSAGDNSQLLSSMLNSGAVRSLVATIKAQPKMTKHVTTSLKFMQKLACTDAGAATLVEEGVVDACVAALRANGTTPDIAKLCMGTLWAVSSHEEGAHAIIKQGGSRQVIAMVHANVGTPHFHEPMERALSLLHRLAGAPEAADMLIKQGGVEAVVEATDFLLRAARTGGAPAAVVAAASGAGAAAADAPSAAAVATTSQTLASSAKVLALLLTVDDVVHAVHELDELAVAAARRLPSLDVALPVVSRIAHMSTVGNFADALVRNGGAEALSKLTSVLLSKCDNAKPDDVALKSELLPLAFKAVAYMSRVAKLDDSLGFANALSRSVEEGIALSECLECIQSIAGSSEAASYVLVHDGRTLPMLSDTLRANLRNTDVATSCFHAVKALAAHASLAPVVANTDLLQLITSWLDDNNEDAPSEALQAALSTAASLTLDESQVAAVLEAGVVDLAKTIMARVGADGTHPDKRVFASIVRLLSRVAKVPAGAERLNTSALLRRTMRCIAASPAFMNDEDSMLAVLQLVTDCAAVPSVTSDLNSLGVLDLVVDGMSANGTSTAVAQLGASALQALGASEEAGRHCVEEVKRLAAAVEGATEVTEDMILQLGDAVQRMQNFMMIPGVVTAASAAEMMSVLSNAASLMAESDMAKPDHLASAVQAIGRVSELAPESLALDDSVGMVMDVMAMSGTNVAVREAAVHTLGMLSQHASALKAMHEAGGMDLIMQAAKATSGGGGGGGSSSDSRLQGLADSAIARMAENVTKNASTLVQEEGGAETLAAVVEAAGGDALQLTAVLNNIIAVEGGDDALYAVMCSASASPDVLCETMRVLRERDTSAVTVHSVKNSARRMKGLTTTLQAAAVAQASLTAASDQRSKMQALRLAENSLSLLGMMEFDALSADAFFNARGIDALMQFIGANADDPDTVSSLLTVLHNAAQFMTVEGASQMAEPSNMGTLVALMKMSTTSPQVIASIMEIIASTVRVIGPEASGLDADGLRAVVAAAEALKDDARVTSSSAQLQELMSAQISEASALTRAMTNSLTQLSHVSAEASAVQELVSEDGHTYYLDTATNTTTWEAPAAFVAFKAALSAASDAAAAQMEDASVTTADAATITCMVNALSNHLRNATVAQNAAQTLSALANNATNAEAIARSGGISAVIAAISVNPDNVALLRVLVILMERMSRSDQFKDQIATSGGVEILLTVVLGRHVLQEELVLRSLSTLANLAFNSPSNVKLIMERGGLSAVERCLQTWPKHSRILENAMCVLSNLMYGSDENKLAIGQTCGDEVTAVIRDNPKDVNLFRMALRALGNLAYCDENIRFIVETNAATKAIVTGMRAHPKDEEVLQVAIEVIGNFASLDEPAPEVDEEGNVINPRDSIPMIILREAGCAEIISTMKRFPHNSALLKAGLDSLANIANDVDVTELMARKQNLLPTIIDTIRAHDWDEELVKHAVVLLATVSYSRECLPLMAQLDTVQVLMSAMQQHSGTPGMLQTAAVALTNMAADEGVRVALQNSEGVRMLFGILEHNLGVKGFVDEAIRTLTRLCTDDKLSSAIAEQGMHILMGAVEKYKRDPEFLTSAFRLLGHLAFVESNLTIIVQHNGIQRVISSIMEHPDHQPLMVRAIQTLDNIAMANKENAAIVIDEGGKELIEMIMTQEQYMEDEDVQRYGKSALLSMSALENLSKSAEITAKAAKASALKPKKDLMAEPARPADPLAEFRHMLSAGKVMKVWSKGSPTVAHVLTSPDFKSIVWQDVKSQKKLGAMDMRQVTAVKQGLGDGHKRSAFAIGGKAAEAELCLSVVGDRNSLDLECTTTREVKSWVDALTRLLTVYRTSPHLL